MQYTRVSFICNPSSEAVKDVLAAMLGRIGFDAFMDAETTMEAYIPTSSFSPVSVDQVLANFPVEATIHYSAEEMEDRDWNEEWETTFNRSRSTAGYVSIARFTGWRVNTGTASDRPQDVVRHGSPRTTRLMLEELLEMDLSNKAVLDMGCGTTVLYHLVLHRGAGE